MSDSADRLNRSPIRLWVVAIGLTAGIPARVSAAPPVLAPEWTWSPTEGIEWVAETRLGGAELLAATRAGTLHLLSLDSGEQLLPAPIQARPGLRPVAAPVAIGAEARRSASLGPLDPPQSEDLAYCFDRFTVLAVRLGQRPGAAWRVGTWREDLAEPTPRGADPARTFQGDPEELRQLLAAAATPWGPIVVRDDGHFGLLDRTDGHVLWQRSLERMAMARLHVRASEAALLWRSGPEVRAISVDVRTGEFREYPLLPERPWPFWSALTEGGLVLVEPERCIFTTPRAAQMVYRAPAGTDIISASVVLGPEADAAPGSSLPVLVFGTSDGLLHAIDLQSGTERWSVQDLESPGQPWTWVELLGDLVVSAMGDSVHLRVLETGQLPAKFNAGPARRLLDASLAADRVWLIAENADHTGAQFELIGMARPTTTAPATPAETPCFSIDRSGVFLNALWFGRHVVLSTRDGLSAYAVP